jgi:pheromone shutdown-related protein TraB
MIQRIVTEKKEIVLIGTGHVFKESVEEVERVISDEKPEAVCVELDPKRYYALLTGQRMNFIDLVKTRGVKFGIVAGFLEYVERKIGEEMGVFPGKEMLTAAQLANSTGAHLYLIDRDVEITVEKMTRIPLREKLSLLKTFLFSPFQKEINYDLTSETIEDLIKELRTMSPHLYTFLIEERDRIMAERIRKVEESKIVAVVGAGHLKGIVKRIPF